LESYEQAYASLKAGDIDAARKHYTNDLTVFHPDGTLLENPDFDAMKTWVENGFKINPGPFQHYEVKVYDKTAVITGYQRMTFTRRDSTSATMDRRFTAVLTNVKGQWLIAHQHLSPLTPKNPD
jgi:ketosteroid isomerase-like protein